MHLKNSAKWWIALIPMGFLGTMVIAPLLAMLRYEDANLLWREIITDDYYRWRIMWTVLQAMCTVCLTLVLALPIAWVLARWDFWGKTYWLRVLMLPFIMPTLVVGIGVLMLFGERGWLWRGWADTPYLLLYGNVFFNLPVMIRAAYQGLLSVPASRLFALQTLGANVWQRFWQVEYPVLKPWLAGASCLVFLYCFSGFGLALLLGGQRYATVEVEIYQLIAYELDMARAGVLVWLVLGVTALVSVGYAWLSHQTNSVEVRPYLPQRIHTWQQRGVLWCLLMLFCVCCVLPLLAAVWQALLAGESWQVIGEEETLHALWNTLRFTLMSVLLAAVLGLTHAFAARQWRVVRTLTFLPFMVSPVCLAFGVLLLYPEWTASLGLLMALYTLIAYPFVTKDVLAAWDALPTHYTTAAQVFGATSWRIHGYIVFPLIQTALRRGLTFAAATGIGEFAATLFLSRPEWNTLTTLIYQYLGKVGADNHDKAAVLTVVLMGLASVVFVGLDGKAQHKTPF